MERKYPHLCKPIRIGNVWYRNRMFSTPMGGTDIELDGCIGPKSQAFYEYRAKGGCAAVTVSELMVRPSGGRRTACGPPGTSASTISPWF